MSKVSPLLQRSDGQSYAALADNSGAQYVNVVNGGSGGTSSADESAFVAGETLGTPMMGEGGGEVLVVAVNPANRKLQVEASVSITPPSSSTSSVPIQKTVGLTSVPVLAANPSRMGCGIQNTGSRTIYLGLGQTPTNTVYHIALASSGASDDGYGGKWDGTISGVLWLGAVNAIASGVGGTCVPTELT